MTLLSLLILLAIMLVAIMTGAWLVAARTGKTGWIDAFWSLGVGAASMVAALVPLQGITDHEPRQWLVALMAGGWSLRLGLHIVGRSIKGGDDPRYKQLMKDWGSSARSRLFLFLQIQALAGFILAVTALAASRNPAPSLGLADWLGLAILIIAVVGEGTADRQLKAFAADPSNKGEVCDVGLWSVSRHPNYFFEFVGWVAYPVIAVGTDLHVWGLVALLGPLMMYWLLAHVSGVPPLEAHMLRSRGDKFRAYQNRVNAFWPGPPSKHPKAETRS